jgi:cardiolipin synthase (CMP-forming)
MHRHWQVTSGASSRPAVARRSAGAARSQRARLRLRHLVLAPALLSWARVPLAVCFPLVVDRPVAALGVLLAAGLSDVLDGWVARRRGLTTATGAVLDPITDKLFVLTVAVTLVATGRLSIGSVLLLSTRELGELPLAVWYAWKRAGRSSASETPMANVGGKLATCLQFAAVAWALFRLPRLEWSIAATATAGVLAAIGYWSRALRGSTNAS